MAFTKQGAFSKKVTDLTDKPSPSYSAADIKSYFETPSDELKITLNNALDLLNSTASGNSGADNIGATYWDGLTASNIQALLNYLNSGKTDLMGDHKGTWHGLDPSQAEPALSADVTAAKGGFSTLSEKLNSKGVYLDDFIPKNYVGDVSAIIQQAHDYLIKNGGGRIIFTEGKSYKANLNLNIDVSKVKFDGSNVVLDFSGLTSGSAFTFTGNDADMMPYTQSFEVFDGIEVKGPGSSSDTVCFTFKTSHVTLKGCFHDFGKIVDIQDNAYVISFQNSDLYHANIVVNQDNGYTNYGERITFINCNLYNAKTLVNQGNPNSDMKFIGCSFDYHTSRSVNITAGTVTLVACHIEANDDSGYWWNVTGENSLLQIIGGGTIAVTGDKANVTAYELGYCDASVNLGGIEILDTKISLPAYHKQFLIAGSGRVTARNIKTNKNDQKFVVASSLNLLRDGNFNSANSLLDWDLTDDLPTYDTGIKHEGTGSLKFQATTAGNSSTAKKVIPCLPNQLVFMSYYVKRTIVANNDSFYANINYLDSKGNIIQSYTYTMTTDTDWSLHVEQNNVLAPPGTTQAQISLTTGASHPTSSVFIDNLNISVL